MNNNPQQVENSFRTVSDVVRFVNSNPQRFIELLNTNADMRQNMSQILKNTNSSEIIDIAYAVQGKPTIHPITGMKTILDPFAQNFVKWLDYERVQLNENPYHKMESPKEKFDFIKALEQDDELRKLSQKKKKEIEEAALKSVELSKELMNKALSVNDFTQKELEFLRGDFMRRMKNGDFESMSEKEINIVAKFTLGASTAEKFELAGETKTEQMKNATIINYAKTLVNDPSKGDKLAQETPEVREQVEKLKDLKAQNASTAQQLSVALDIAEKSLQVTTLETKITRKHEGKVIAEFHEKMTQVMYNGDEKAFVKDVQKFNKDNINSQDEIFETLAQTGKVNKKDKSYENKLSNQESFIPENNELKASPSELAEKYGIQAVKVDVLKQANQEQAQLNNQLQVEPVTPENNGLRANSVGQI